jgi:hypothetical protein
LRLGFINGGTQRSVGIKIGSTGLGGDHNLLDQSGEQLAALGVLRSFSMLDIRPFAVTRHDIDLAKSALSYHFSGEALPASGEFLFNSDMFTFDRDITTGF